MERTELIDDRLVGRPPPPEDDFVDTGRCCIGGGGELSTEPRHLVDVGRLGDVESRFLIDERWVVGDVEVRTR